MFTQSEDEALALFGDNYRRIEVLDPAQTLHVGTKARQSVLRKMDKAGKKPIVSSEGATNPFSNDRTPWFSTPGMADALEQVSRKITAKGPIGQLYHSLLLYPKATSQIAKTILSPELIN